MGNELKAGIRSTEFYLSAAAVIGGVIISSGILDDTATEWDNKIVGLALSILAALGYTAARTVAKMKRPPAE